MYIVRTALLLEARACSEEVLVVLGETEKPPAASTGVLYCHMWCNHQLNKIRNLGGGKGAMVFYFATPIPQHMTKATIRTKYSDMYEKLIYKV